MVGTDGIDADQLDSVAIDDEKVEACVTALLQDYLRQSDHLALTDVERTVARRHLTVAEGLEVRRQLIEQSPTKGG